MHKYSSVRVGVAGATGYAGLELLRRLSRHPGADVRFAMASGASEAKRLPGLAKIWDRPVEPLDVDRLASETDAVFLAVPETLAAELGPALASRGPRVFDLSGAFRLRSTPQSAVGIDRYCPIFPDSSVVHGVPRKIPKVAQGNSDGGPLSSAI